MGHSQLHCSQPGVCMHKVSDLVGPALRHVVGQSRCIGSGAAHMAVYRPLEFSKGGWGGELRGEVLKDKRSTGDICDRTPEQFCRWVRYVFGGGVSEEGVIVGAEGGPGGCVVGGALVPESEVLHDPVVYLTVVREGALVWYAEALQSKVNRITRHMFEVSHVCIDGEPEVMAEPPVEHALNRLEKGCAEQWVVYLLKLGCAPCTRPEPGLGSDCGLP